MSVSLEAQMRLERGWAVVWVHNVSRQGMLLWSSRPPRPGAYIELRRATTTIIARAVWVRDKFFGIRTEAPLDIGTLTSTVARQPARMPSTARRAEAMPAANTPSRRPRGNQVMPSTIDFALVAICLALGSGVAALLEYRSLAAIARTIASRMLGGP